VAGYIPAAGLLGALFVDANGEIIVSTNAPAWSNNRGNMLFRLVFINSDALQWRRDLMTAEIACRVIPGLSRIYQMPCERLFLRI
jgi:hypothetical protein